MNVAGIDDFHALIQEVIPDLRLTGNSCVYSDYHSLREKAVPQMMPKNHLQSGASPSKVRV
jgi:hypothetical protein